jgi:hypothetical protein
MNRKFIVRDIKVDGTSNKFEQLYNKTTEDKFILRHGYSIYYNTELDFSYDPILCTRKRPIPNNNT